MAAAVLAVAPARAEPPSAARLLDALAGVALDRAALARACAAEPLCIARRAAAAVAGARLERVAHPDSDTIRWVTSAPSLTAPQRLAGGGVAVGIERFGRTVERELAAALAGEPPHLVLDLRRNGGGDLGRMLRVAGALVGPRRAALLVHGTAGRAARDLPAVEPLAPGAAITVLIGPATASSAEVLAALLRAHGKARLLGARTLGKDRLTRVVPVSHDWRLLLPGARLEVPGVRLAGGLRPDGPLPPTLAAAP